ncbi:hypothetical protein HYW94_03290 [Candidatus Uhrbacteria bacterium]|nr:hypothetical protein [Candidatus Uhrbacteria bacterium]
MTQKRYIFLIGAVIAAGFMFTDGAYAADLNWSANTPITVGTYNLTIQAGSKARNFILGPSWITVVVMTGDTFTISSANRNVLSANPSYTETCTDTLNSVTVTGRDDATPVVITPRETICTIASTAVTAPVASAPAASAPSTPAPSKPAEVKAPVSEPSIQAPAPSTSTQAPAIQPLQTPSPAPSTQVLALKPEEVTQIKVEAAEIASVPKAAKVGTEEKAVLAEAVDAGLILTTIVRGRVVSAPIAEKIIVSNLLNKELETTKQMDFDEKVALLKQAQYLNDGKLPKTQSDVAEVLKLAKGVPLSDKEIAPKALAAIKRNETAFCKPQACKGFLDFDKYMRGVEPPVGDDAEERQVKGMKLFKQKVGKTPDLSNLLHENLVDAFAYADLSKVSPAPKAKPKTKQAVQKAAQKTAPAQAKKKK